MFVSLNNMIRLQRNHLTFGASPDGVTAQITGPNELLSVTLNTGAFGRLFSHQSSFCWRIARSSWQLCEWLHGSDGLSFEPRRDLSMGLWWFQLIWFSLWAQPTAASTWFTYFAGLLFSPSQKGNSRSNVLTFALLPMFRDPSFRSMVVKCPFLRNKGSGSLVEGLPGSNHCKKTHCPWTNLKTTMLFSRAWACPTSEWVKPYIFSVAGTRRLSKPKSPKLFRPPRR